MVLALAVAVADGRQNGPLDPNLPEYRRTGAVSGTLIAAGSDTMLVLQALMAEAFRELHPQVAMELEGKGSATAPPALTESAVHIANMSRRILSREAATFEERFGYEPIRFDVALDTVGVFVHRDNPLRHLTLQQIDSIFSSTRRCGGARDITRWGELGLEGGWSSAPISLFGRNAASGTYGFFKRHALCRGDYKPTVKEQPGSASVVQGVERDRYGIGYSGIGYATAGVRAVPILLDDATLVEPSFENAANGRYPLARFLEVYVNKPPGQPLDPLTHEYLRFMLSRDGQQVVVRAGFYPIDAETAARELGKIGPG